MEEQTRSYLFRQTPGIRKMKFLRKVPYWYLLAVPLLLIVLGAVFNQSVLIANHGKFPVMLNEGQVIKFCSIDGDADEMVKDIPITSCSRGGQMIDDTHSIMGPNSHLKALSDIIPLGDTIYSIGDMFLTLGFWLLTITLISWATLILRKVLIT